jgi:hypothetical protein
MAVGTCILLANGKCLPPPPIFDLPPPPDPTLIWHLIAEDGSTSEAIERVCLFVKFHEIILALSFTRVHFNGRFLELAEKAK